MVWKEAHKEAKNYVGTDRRVLAGNIVLAAVSGFITTRIVDFWSRTSVIPPIIQAVAILAGIIFGFFALYCFHLVASAFWFVPAKFYNEERIEAQKRTWKDIEITPFTFPAGSGFGVGLQIISDKPAKGVYDVELTEAEIVQIVHNGETYRFGTSYGGSNLDLELVYGRGEMFTRENRKELANRIYSNELSTFVVIARCDGERAYIESLNSGNEQALPFVVDNRNPCWITIEIKSNLGIIEHIPMEGCLITCKLSYDPSENKFLISNLTREPKYEKW